jgi:hypothetical protein
VSRVDFNVTVGTTVPTHVTIVDVPPALIELNPKWRGYRYFVVEEEVIIVMPERRIVAVVPVGRSQAGSSGGTTVVELPDQEDDGGYDASRPVQSDAVTCYCEDRRL